MFCGVSVHVLNANECQESRLRRHLASGFNRLDDRRDDVGRCHAFDLLISSTASISPAAVTSA